MTRLEEIRRRLANLDSVPPDRSFEGVFEEFLDLARADMKYLLELYDNRPFASRREEFEQAGSFE